MRRALVVFAVALLATSAGCAALGSGDDDLDREPYDVEDPLDSRNVPGVTDGEITDEIVLRNAYSEALANESYALSFRTTVRNDTAVVRSQELTQTVDDDGAEVIRELNTERMDVAHDGIVSTHVWRAGGEAYTRYANVDGGVHYQPISAYSIDPIVPFSLLEAYQVVDAVEREPTGYRLRGSGAVSGHLNATVNLRLAVDGVLESFRVEGETTDQGERRYVEHVGLVERGDGVEVGEPDWLEEARAAFGDD